MKGMLILLVMSGAALAQTATPTDILGTFNGKGSGCQTCHEVHSAPVPTDLLRNNLPGTWQHFPLATEAQQKRRKQGGPILVRHPVKPSMPIKGLGR
jgi:hypothetical protein